MAPGSRPGDLDRSRPVMIAPLVFFFSFLLLPPFVSLISFAISTARRPVRSLVGWLVGRFGRSIVPRDAKTDARHNRGELDSGESSHRFI